MPEDNVQTVDGLYAIAKAINRLADILEKVAEETKESGE